MRRKHCFTNFLRVMSRGVLLTCTISLVNAQLSVRVSVNPKQVTVGDIRISSTETEIIQTLGKPRWVKKGFDEPRSQRSKTFYYRGLTIYLIKGQIYNLSCKSSKFRTEKGIRVGDLKEKDIAAYGQGIPPNPKAVNDSLSYPFEAMDDSLIFHFKDGRLIEIEFFINYV